MTADEFIARYKPEIHLDGECFVPRDWPHDGESLDRALEERRCWTLVTVDGRPGLVSGHTSRDRLHSVIAEVPFEEGESLTVDIDEGYEE